MIFQPSLQCRILFARAGSPFLDFSLHFQNTGVERKAISQALFLPKNANSSYKTPWTSHLGSIMKLCLPGKNRKHTSP
jgi:hypothetical protein